MGLRSFVIQEEILKDCPVRFASDRLNDVMGRDPFRPITRIVFLPPGEILKGDARKKGFRRSKMPWFDLAELNLTFAGVGDRLPYLAEAFYGEGATLDVVRGKFSIAGSAPLPALFFSQASAGAEEEAGLLEWRFPEEEEQLSPRLSV